jgi:hypothetical protein
MIGINVHCMVKMWMSENYGCSKPDFPAGSARGEGTEKDMASMIVRLIWNNTAKQASQSLRVYDECFSRTPTKKLIWS